MPELYSGPVGYAPLPARPFTLLEALGEVTAAPLTPEGELLLWAGSWAVFRYLWAFDDVNVQTGELRMHPVTDNLRHHRRQLFSEDFGIAVAMRALTQHLWGGGQPPLLLDADWELENLVARGVVTWTGPKRPDYVGWFDSAAGPTFVVLECKGCSKSRSESIRQLRDGLEQAISVRANHMPTRHFVVGSAVSRPNHRIVAHAVEVAPSYPILEPPPAPAELDVASNVLDRAHQARLLRLVGAHAEAAKLLGHDEHTSSRARSLILDGDPYRGQTLPIPASNGDGTLVVALRESSFEEAVKGSPRAIDAASRSRARLTGSGSDWLLGGSREPLPEQYLTGPWASITSTRQRQRLHEDTVEQDLPPVAWRVTTADDQAGVETLDGLRLQVAPRDDSETT